MESLRTELKTEKHSPEPKTESQTSVIPATANWTLDLGNKDVNMREDGIDGASGEEAARMGQRGEEEEWRTVEMQRVVDPSPLSPQSSNSVSLQGHDGCATKFHEVGRSVILEGHKIGYKRDNAPRFQWIFVPFVNLSKVEL